MRILDLPNELLLLIGENLSVKDLSHFLSTGLRLSNLLTPLLHDLALENVGDLTALQWAAASGHAKLAELVISKGVETVEHPHRQTPLHTAAACGHPDVIRVLVEHGMRTAVTDSTLQTPLHMAVIFQSARAVRVLLELGADMTCTDKWGKSPIYYAARSGGVDIVRAFADAGLDFTQKVARGRTILHEAVLSGEDVVECILLNGGREVINVQDPTGATPLHDALRNPWEIPNKIYRLLLYHGADTEVKDNSGHTPLDYYTPQESDRLDGMLLEHRAYSDSE